MKEVFIVLAKRTPIGGFLGKLSTQKATELGAKAIKAVLKSTGIQPENIDSVYMGNGVSANLGQAPARQAAIGAGIPVATDATTINKVCASGMKAIAIGAQQIQLGQENLVIAGGMESMSNAPFYASIRNGNKFGNTAFTDGLLKDGLTDAYQHFHMGNAAEMTVRKFNISREAQDEYALQSYQRAQQATEAGKFKEEIVPVEITSKKGTTLIDTDEDIHKLIPEKVPHLKPSFEQEGTITAANASNLNDGAAAVLLASKEAVEQYDLNPVAKIIAYADGACEPEYFSTAPAIAAKRVLKQAQLEVTDIDYFEINEAYASVVLANAELLQLDLDKVNVYGGAVSLGHPIGASGARIIATLTSVLQQENGKLGLAAICNGGGGSSAMLIENLMVSPN